MPLGFTPRSELAKPLLKLLPETVPLPKQTAKPIICRLSGEVCSRKPKQTTGFASTCLSSGSTAQKPRVFPPQTHLVQYRATLLYSALGDAARRIPTNFRTLSRQARITVQSNALAENFTTFSATPGGTADR